MSSEKNKIDEKDLDEIFKRLNAKDSEFDNPLFSTNGKEKSKDKLNSSDNENNLYSNIFGGASDGK